MIQNTKREGAVPPPLAEIAIIGLLFASVTLPAKSPKAIETLQRDIEKLLLSMR